jgi:hypothetical protein
LILHVATLNESYRSATMKVFFEFVLACLVISLCACKPGGATPDGTSNVSGPARKGIAELKARLQQAIQAKSADKFVDCYFIEERFNSPAIREENRKGVEPLLQRETTTIEIQEIPPNELAEIRKIQSAHPATRMRYSLDPKMMLEIRQQAENGAVGRRFLIGEQKGKWFIVTMAGRTT